MFKSKGRCFTINSLDIVDVLGNKIECCFDIGVYGAYDLYVFTHKVAVLIYLPRCPWHLWRLRTIFTAVVQLICI